MKANKTKPYQANPSMCNSCNKTKKCTLAFGGFTFCPKDNPVELKEDQYMFFTKERQAAFNWLPCN